MPRLPNSREFGLVAYVIIEDAARNAAALRYCTFVTAPPVSEPPFPQARSPIADRRDDFHRSISRYWITLYIYFPVFILLLPPNVITVLFYVFIRVHRLTPRGVIYLTDDNLFNEFN